jgi:dipeptidyl aminopeptidase/acylaminoacyl peptidase
VGQGALVLQTNYRGSSGYGEAFQSLNLRNLGVGPATDILAGINYLDSLGIIDPNRIGCLGWSQGGHISAMLATYSNRCTAAHMGAGISNWKTYYYNTDITPFTVEYFGKTPSEDDDIYNYTSPITYIDRAETPVLIQHGEKDNRVPIANAYELRQALIDNNVENSFIIYKGMPHGPRRPDTLNGVITHLDEWFKHYLFDGAKPDFITPILPANEGKDDK